MAINCVAKNLLSSEKRDHIYIGGSCRGSVFRAGDKLLQVGLCYTGISQAEAAPGLSDEHSGDCTAVH